eukprot:gene37555-50698_t
MKRRKFTKERLALVRGFYQKLFHGEGIFAERLERVQPMATQDPAIAEILDFIAAGSDSARMTDRDLSNASPVGLIAGGGTLPFAVADSLLARGITPVLFALKGICDPASAARYRHHWIPLGQLGRLSRLMRSDGCRDLVFIGALVRPALSEIRLDWGTLRAMPRILSAFRGGDDHLLTGIGRADEQSLSVGAAKGTFDLQAGMNEGYAAGEQAAKAAGRSTMGAKTFSATGTLVPAGHVLGALPQQDGSAGRAGHGRR